MNEFNLSSKEIAYLRRRHKQEKDRWAADRIKAVVLLSTGWTQEAVSEALMLTTDTLRNYRDKYTSGGVDALLKRDYSGRESKLSDSIKDSIKTHLSEYTYPDVKSICAYVKKTYNIILQETRMRAVLRELGFSYKKPTVLPSQTDPVESIKFLRRYESLRRSGKPLYFSDGVHAQHNSQPSYGWILKGHDKALLSNTGRQRVNLNGMVNIDTHAMIIRTDDSINAQSTISLLKQVAKRHKKDDKVYIVCDNAGYYRSRLVKAYLESINNKIELVYLPPYSPFFNLIERVWKFFKKNIVYNKYYRTFQEFKSACLNFFKRSHKRALEKILVEKFHFPEELEMLKAKN